MKLSVIIVNYNVKYFLEQCLHAVRKAVRHIEAEVFVVDNNSVDGSPAMVREKFPEVKLIENKKNTGFSKANNQAIRIAQGEYVLLLNPDTVVEETTFEKIIEFMDAHPKAGALGVKMIDGNGSFLPESKRAMPTPMVSFYKIFGFSRLFPKSKTFGRYHLGYLSEDETHQVEILCGAFMFMRKEALDKVGYLDENFFMYGEDIDLSYRIIKGGYQNYYFAGSTIIHYKGESTKKGSLNYVFVFYNAMIIFAQKHFSKKNADFYTFFIRLAIYFRAALSVFKRIAFALLFPLLDALLIFAGYYFIKPHWENVIFPDGGTYPPVFLQVVVPVYILIWLVSIFFAGGYDRPVRLKQHAKGLAVGTAIILIIYALIDVQYRFSRALILIGTVWAFAATLLLRLLFHLTGHRQLQIALDKRKRIAIVGEKEETRRVKQILEQVDLRPEIVGSVSPSDYSASDDYIGNINQLADIVKINKIDEIIFCAKNINSQEIIQKMLELSQLNVAYKIAPPESISIIGSNSIDTAGDFYVVNISSIATKASRRNKRTLDILLSLWFIVFSPVLLIINYQHPWQFLKNCIAVFSGKISWVGYYSGKNISTAQLPKIKAGVLTPLQSVKRKKLSTRQIEKVNIIYAKNYKILNDLIIIGSGLNQLGKTSDL